MSTNIGYYEKIRELQTVQHETEQKRLGLEKELNAHLHSDQRLSKLKTVRLQNYWKKICEDEKRSLQRNDQLQREFQRVEAHMALMAERTQKLERMKREYENYIEKTYPNWRDIVAQRAQQAQMASAEAQRQERDRVMEGLYNPVPTYQQQQNFPSLQEYKRQLPPTSYTQQQVPSSSYTQQQSQPQHREQQYPSQNPLHQVNQQQQFPSQTQLNIQQQAQQFPSQTQLNMQQQAQQFPSQTQLNMQQQAQQFPSQTQLNMQQQAQQFPSQERLNQQQKRSSQQSIPSVYVEKAESSPSFSHQHQMQQKQSSSHRVIAVNVPARDQDQTDDVSDLSDDSAPLTPQDLEPAPVYSQVKQSPLVSSASQQQNSAGHGQKNHSVADMVPPPGVTAEGLYNLLTAVEGDLSNADSAPFIYKADVPASSVTKDIISNANRGTSLMYVNAETISMVILDQLPLFVAHSSPAACVFPDNMLKQGILPTTAQELKRHIPVETHGLFEQLYEHFIQLMRHDVMTPADIADVFSPILISPQSTLEEQGRRVLASLFEHVDPSLLVASARSTSTFSTLPSARKPSSHGGVSSKPSATSTQPPKSTAYQQMLGGGSLHTGIMPDSEDDSQDDIENQLGLSSPPPTTPQPGKTSSSNLGGGLKNPVQAASPVGSPTPRAASLSDSDTPSFNSPQPSSKHDLPADKPKTETKEPLITSLNSSTKKNPAFNFDDSDTDEDVNLTNTGKSTGKFGEAEDDFDFYG